MSSTSKPDEAKGSKDSDEQGKENDKQQPPTTIDALRRYLSDKLNLFSSNEEDDEDITPKGIKILETLDFDGLMKHWKNKGFKNIITMVGAGISTSAGIPDFRSPDTGLYNNLQKFNLPYREAIFELSYFMRKPKPFFVLAKDLYPGTLKPTPCHYFIKLLMDKGLLVRNYTQNIDTLERIAGMPDDMLVEAHGSFYTNHCLSCKKEYPMEWMKEKIFNDEIPKCIKSDCEGLIKPDIVFFGENLPDKFYELPGKDFEKCDLLLIIGTSLEVQPFASLINFVDKNCVRVLINLEEVGQTSCFGEGLYYHLKNKNTRDIALIGDCDTEIQKIADALGWGDELKELIEKEHKKLDEVIGKNEKKDKANT